MSVLIQPLVDTCNRVLNTGSSLATSVLTINYHIGDSLFTAIKWIYTSFISLVCWLSTGLRIVLEDLVVFLVDISDSLLASWNLATNIIDSTVSGVFGSLQMVSSFVSRSIDSVLSGGIKSYQAAQYCANNIGVFFNLLGTNIKYYILQCFGSGSGWIRIIGPDPDPLQETLIWIRVPKKNRDKLAYKSTKIIKI